MRLKKVERGHKLRHRVKLALIRVASRQQVADIVRTLFYRPELFGTPFAKNMQQILRGPSEWTVGERELFGAFVSQQNQCVY